MASYWLLYFFIYLFSYHIAQTVQEEIEYECVDIYKQPAFQHPLMKDHQIQMRPSVEFQAMVSTEPETSDLFTGESEERCPKGQVPIHIPQFNYTNNFSQPKKIIAEANLHYAIIRPFENYTKRWDGAQAVFNIYKPRVLTNQFSKAWIWLNHREKDVISSIQFGWAVHTGLYRDDRPRLTTYWISGRHPNGCYNVLCRGGYVQVHKTIYPGMVYNKVSTLGKRQSTAHLLVGQDSRTKNWLLMTRSILIGYWPHQIYSMQGASQVLFGGYTGGLAGATSPPMGAGTFPKEVGYRNKFSCFMKQLKCFEDKRLVDIDSNEFEEYVDSPKCYDVWFRKFEIGKGEMLTFGGPGGECGI
ncbi:Neprosin activation peptide [Arabidopsis thaliana x Arabidopsis arenosa]|uniref:Neprosin activation peptide n=1 Tax=Arabidopsis thaliana x Arabidopsis arenosa TaxID=1240361 RepID=A0A8T1YCA7_9BRAS|nr:Neprosin activation peptide [Arabidopsis thaliana x Arabidopsis arenosa]